MASSENPYFGTAYMGYANAANAYGGNAGYQNSVNQSRDVAKQQTKDAYTAGVANGQNITNTVNKTAQSGANTQTANSTNSAIDKGAQMSAAQNQQALTAGAAANEAQNRQAQKYAAQQAQAAAAGAQSQATTAARAAGMNKAQAAMMGSQQNANAYQNAYGNAYGQQLNQAANQYGQQLGNAQANQNAQLSNYNSAYENQANRANANINNQQGIANTNMGNQQSLALQSGQNLMNAYGTMLGAGQQEGQAQYDRTWGNWGNGLGIGGSLLKAFSDEGLKHYRECSKKVVMRTPSKIKTLKFESKKE